MVGQWVDGCLFGFSPPPPPSAFGGRLCVVPLLLWALVRLIFNSRELPLSYSTPTHTHTLCREVESNFLSYGGD